MVPPPVMPVVPGSQDVVACIRTLCSTGKRGQVVVELSQPGAAEGLAAQIRTYVPNAQVVHAAWTMHDAFLCSQKKSASSVRVCIVTDTQLLSSKAADKIRVKCGIDTVLVLIVTPDVQHIKWGLSIRTQHVVTLRTPTPTPEFSAALAQHLGDIAPVVFDLNCMDSLPTSTEPVSDDPDAVIVLDAHASKISIGPGTPIVLWESSESVAPYKRAKLTDPEVFRSGMPGIVLNVDATKIVTVVLGSGAVGTICSTCQPFPFVCTRQVIPRSIAHLSRLYPLFEMNTINYADTRHL